MNKLRKQIALVFVALFATVCVFSSCSEEESMIDAEREHKVQELLSVSKALAKKHEIGLCFTERMIRGGIDTLTVEDLEQAYEVFAANTVEISVCTDSVRANSNGLKLSRSTRVYREEVELWPGEGGTLLANYQLIWTPRNNRAAIDYGGELRMRIDWGYYYNECIPYFLPNGHQGTTPVTYPLRYSVYLEPLEEYDDYYENEDEDDHSENLNRRLVFEGESEFQLIMADGIHCEFVVWAKETVYTRIMRLTLIGYSSNLQGDFSLTDNGSDVHA